MTHILHVVAAPRGPRSLSRALTDAVVTAYVRRRPSASVDTLDLWTSTETEFSPAHVDAKMTVIGGGAPIGAARRAWSSAVDAFARLAAADLLVFGVPMRNGGIDAVDEVRLQPASHRDPSLHARRDEVIAAAEALATALADATERGVG